VTAQHIPHLKVRLAHRYPLLGLGAAGNDATVVVAQYHDRRAYQVGAEYPFAAGVEAVAVDQGEYG